MRDSAEQVKAPLLHSVVNAVVAFSASVSLAFLLMLTGGVGYLRQGDD